MCLRGLWQLKINFEKHLSQKTKQRILEIIYKERTNFTVQTFSSIFYSLSHIGVKWKTLLSYTENNFDDNKNDNIKNENNHDNLDYSKNNNVNDDDNERVKSMNILTNEKLIGSINENTENNSENNLSSSATSFSTSFSTSSSPIPFQDSKNIQEIFITGVSTYARTMKIKQILNLFYVLRIMKIKLKIFDENIQKILLKKIIFFMPSMSVSGIGNILIYFSCYGKDIMKRGINDIDSNLSTENEIEKENENDDNDVFDSLSYSLPLSDGTTLPHTTTVTDTVTHSLPHTTTNTDTTTHINTLSTTDTVTDSVIVGGSQIEVEVEKEVEVENENVTVTVNKKMKKTKVVTAKEVEKEVVVTEEEREWDNIIVSLRSSFLDSVQNIVSKEKDTISTFISTKNKNKNENKNNKVKKIHEEGDEEEEEENNDDENENDSGDQNENHENNNNSIDISSIEIERIISPFSLISSLDAEIILDNLNKLNLNNNLKEEIREYLDVRSHSMRE